MRAVQVLRAEVAADGEAAGPLADHAADGEVVLGADGRALDEPADDHRPAGADREPRADVSANHHVAGEVDVADAVVEVARDLEHRHHVDLAGVPEHGPPAGGRHQAVVLDLGVLARELGQLDAADRRHVDARALDRAPGRPGLGAAQREERRTGLDEALDEQAVEVDRAVVELARHEPRVRVEVVGDLGVAAGHGGSPRATHTTSSSGLPAPKASIAPSSAPRTMCAEVMSERSIAAVTPGFGSGPAAAAAGLAAPVAPAGAGASAGGGAAGGGAAARLTGAGGRRPAGCAGIVGTA